MSKLPIWLGTAALAAVIVGCTTTDSTNLTPRHLPKEASGQYHFETTWSSNRKGVGTNVQAYVIVDSKLYPMSPVPYTRDRYEALVPLPSGKNYIPYQYRFDFEYPGAFKKSEKNSDLSPSYRLIIPWNSGEPASTNEPGK